MPGYSRLYRAIKKERGLAGSVWASYEAFRTLGVFTLGAEVNNDDPAPTETAVFDEVRRIADKAVGEDELNRVRTRIRSSLVSAQEEVLGMARSLAWYEAAGTFTLVDDYPTALYEVTAKDVQEAANDYVVNGRATLLEYLPEANSAPNRSVRRD